MLFFDDPADPWLPLLQGIPDVAAIACDAAHWASLGIARPDTQEVRQITNANIALRMAREQGADWLAHIDSDELIHTDGRTIGQILDTVQGDMARFDLREAIAPDTPARHTFDALWFRVSIPLDAVARLDPALRVGERWLRGHIASKVAVRIASPVEQIGIHWVDIPPMTPETPQGARLLHFPCIMLDRWREHWKRRRDGSGTVGSMGDHRWIQAREAEDAYGDPAAEQAAFARMHQMAPELRARLTPEGLVEQILLDPASLAL